MIKFIASLFGKKSKNLLAEVLKIAEFREWLKGKEPSKIVGLTHISYQCPIARYLNAKGFERIMVGSSSIFASIKGKAYYITRRDALPVWVSHFVDNVDCKSGCREVTAAEALEVLEKL